MELTTMGRDLDRGMTLKELRAFVRETQDWPEDTWMDCLVPTDKPREPIMAALMGLYAGAEMSCPRCGTRLEGAPVRHSLSRVDNTTRICSDCGNREAIYNHFWPEADLPPVDRDIRPFLPKAKA